MEFRESERLELDSGAIVWMKDVSADLQDLSEALQHGVDVYAPRLVNETTGGVRNEVPLVRQARDVLMRQLESRLRAEEARTVIERFGIVFHTELDGQVIPNFYMLRD